MLLDELLHTDMSRDMRFPTMWYVRPYAQTNQSPCLSPNYSMSFKLLTELHLEILSLKGGCTGSSESTLVKMTHCWNSQAAAHFLLLCV